MIIDQRRLDAEWEADRDVLRNLAENGDDATIPRTVDISFGGPEAALDALEEEAEALGLTVIEREEDEGGDLFLFLSREQPVTEAAIKSLTLLCLQIEDRFGLDYDGWGCVAASGPTH